MLWPQVPQILAVCDRHSQGGRGRRKGAGCVWGAGKQGKGSGFPNAVGSGRTGERYATLNMGIGKWGMEGLEPSVPPPPPQLR